VVLTVGRYIPAQSANDSYQPRSEIVGPSLKPQYLKDEKKQVEKEEIEQESHMKQLEFLLARSQKKRNQVKSEKSVDRVVSETAKDELVEA
jgi:hypothetical protein